MAKDKQGPKTSRKAESKAPSPLDPREFRAKVVARRGDEDGVPTSLAISEFQFASVNAGPRVINGRSGSALDLAIRAFRCHVQKSRWIDPPPLCQTRVRQKKKTHSVRRLVPFVGATARTLQEERPDAGSVEITARVTNDAGVFVGGGILSEVFDTAQAVMHLKRAL